MGAKPFKKVYNQVGMFKRVARTETPKAARRRPRPYFTTIVFLVLVIFFASLAWSATRLQVQAGTTLYLPLAARGACAQPPCPPITPTPPAYPALPEDGALAGACPPPYKKARCTVPGQD